eukprot:3115233-Rhodomonas_salina.1
MRWISPAASAPWSSTCPTAVARATPPSRHSFSVSVQETGRLASTSTELIAAAVWSDGACQKG